MKNLKKNMAGAGIALTLLTACGTQQPKESTTLSGLNPAKFEAMVNGVKPVKLYTLTNRAGMEVCVTNFGGRLVSIMVPDRTGTMQDVVHGFDNIHDYQTVPSDFGASIGRYANRINQGQITLDGQTIQLPQNNFGHCLHGGPEGWQYQVYEANQLNDSTITLTMHSADGDSNFPGNVTAVVTYALTADNAIDIDYKATTDKKTVINMTNHSYFNLNGDASTTIGNHLLYVASDEITPVDSSFMTTGAMQAVAGTAFDFNTPKTIAPCVTNFDDEQVKLGNGFDHNWVLRTAGDVTQVAAKLTSPVTGITLEVYTNEPGIQVYTGNFLDGTATGKKGVVYTERTAICLETQHYPDSPNKPEWPSVVLEPGQTYHSQCIYKFGVEK